MVIRWLYKGSYECFLRVYLKILYRLRQDIELSGVDLAFLVGILMSEALQGFAGLF